MVYEEILAILGLVGIGGIITTSLAYIYDKRKLLKERELARQENTFFKKIELYKELIKDLELIPKVGESNEEFKKEWVEKMNRHGYELLIFAPDHVYREYMKILHFKKGESMKDVLEFMITLRKELIPETTLKPDDMWTLEGLH
jgi:hypothetical protein